MKRHFGIGGCVSKTPSFCCFLLEMGQELPLAEELRQELERLQQLREQKSELEIMKEENTQVEHLLWGEQVEEQDSDSDTNTEAEGESSEKLTSESTTLNQSMSEQLKQYSMDTESQWAQKPNLCHLIHMDQPQRATIIEWPKEQVSVFNCAWHLKYCMWRNECNGEFNLPNWYVILLYTL